MTITPGEGKYQLNQPVSFGTGKAVKIFVMLGKCSAFKQVRKYLVLNSSVNFSLLKNLTKFVFLKSKYCVKTHVINV